MSSHGNLHSFPGEFSRECDECGELQLRKAFERESFVYGTGSDAVTLEAQVPIWRCAACGHAFTDGEAEEVRHEAICRHLGVLTPREIYNIRLKQGLTQAQFANVTGFGEASIKRWEAGLVVQNVSADRFLRLLDDALIFARLRILVDTSERRRSIAQQTKFQTTLPESTLKQAEVFRLRLRA